MRVSRGSGSFASRIAGFGFLTLVLIGLMAGCGGGGQTTSAPPPQAPSNLAYPQKAITATVGQAISTDTPTVSGTVTSYSVQPALPAGLSLSTSTGAISGMPAAASAQTSYTVTAQNSTGSTAASVQITVSAAMPSNLAYPQATITATVGQAITPDTPSVTGTVSSFSISPALPPGLSLNTSTGTISGTPTAASPATGYTVTAQNAAGSTTATLQITVNGPSGIYYPQTAISAIVGQAIPPDIPSVSGTVSSYVVSPALPAGLTLNASTGTISGTPTAESAQTSYTVTATSPGGTVGEDITITVLPAQNSLLELGHGTAIGALRFSGGKLLSVDHSGHWVLWNYSSGTILASGGGPEPVIAGVQYFPAKPIDMAGQTFVIAIPNGLEVHAVSDGHPLAIIPYVALNMGGSSPWWQLASDGSYICIGSSAGLIAFTPTGQTLFSRTGDYSNAQAFAAPGQVQVALGPAGENVIETVSTADGTSSVGSAFSGQFNSWFLDGSKFITSVQDTLWVYSSTSVQQAFFALPTVEGLTGQGNWVWTFQPGVSGNQIEIYPIGSKTPALSYPGQISTLLAIPSGTALFVSSTATPGQASVIDLSGATPVQTNYNNIPVSLPSNSTFAASSAPQWVVGNNSGALLDGASLSSTPRYFGYGEAWSIAGAPGTAAVSTAIGQTLIFNPSGPSLQQTINYPSDKLVLSSDGTVLGAAENLSGDQPSQNQTLSFYSLPSGNVISGFSYSQQGTSSSPLLADFSLAASGATIGRIINVDSGTTPTGFTREATPIAGSPVIWSDTGQQVEGQFPDDGVSYPDGLSYFDPILLSPDGTLIAEYTGTISENIGTNIIQNGTLVTAVPGAGIEWIDNNRLLVNQYAIQYPYPVAYTGAAIYNATGQQVATLPALPQLASFQTINSDSIYNQNLNAIYSLTTGQPTWTATYPGTGVGAVSGTYVVYASGHSIVVESY